MRDRRFAVLWCCVAAAYLAQWMLPVAAQWFILSRPHGATYVPFVQVALTLPMALLAIPVGVLADRIDRKRLVLGVQCGVLVLEAVLVWLAHADALTPWVLLLLLSALACGIAGTYTPLTAMVPDLVPRESVARASALLTIATNSTRVIGPAVAGFILAAGGIDLAFGATIPATVVLLLALLRMPSADTDVAYERWFSAAWSGLRFVRHSPQALKLLTRNFWFTFGIMAMLSLLPLIAARRGANSAELGGVLAAQGVGAVVGAITLPRLCRRFRSNVVVTFGFASAGLASALALAVPGLVGLAIAVALAGWAWTTMLATVQGEMQLYLPAWVRARGLSVSVVGTFAGQALGAASAGLIAGRLGTNVALVMAAAVLVSGIGLAVLLPLKDLGHLDRSAVNGWAGPEIALSDDEGDRRLQVRVRYEVGPEARHEFLETMVSLRRIRLRVGARRWHLLEDPNLPGVFIEQYLEPSGQDYADHMKSRTIASDRDVALKAEALSASTPTVHYGLRVELPRRV